MKKVLFNVSIVGGLLMLLLAAFSVLAQEEPDFIPVPDEPSLSFHEGSVSTKADVQAELNVQDQASAVASCPTTPCVYLPITTNPPKVSDPLVAHKTNCSAESTVTSIDSSNVVDLGNGQRRLQFAISAQGYEGSSYETYYVINGAEQLHLRSSGTITSDSFSISSIGLVFKLPTETGCQEVFPAGSYGVRFLIDGNIVSELTAILR